MHAYLDRPSAQRYAARRATGWRQQDSAVVLDIEGIRKPDVTGIAAILAGAPLNDALERAELTITVLESGAVRLQLARTDIGGALQTDMSESTTASVIDEAELGQAPVSVTTADGTLRVASERHGGYGPDPEDLTIEITLDPLMLTIQDAGGNAIVRLASSLPTDADSAGIAPFAWLRWIDANDRGRASRLPDGGERVSKRMPIP